MPLTSSLSLRLLLLLRACNPPYKPAHNPSKRHTMPPPPPPSPLPTYTHLTHLPPELLFLITSHLHPRSLCNLAATCRALHTRLDHQRTARFAAAAPNYIYRLVTVQRGRRTPDYARRLAMLNYAADKGCTGVVRRLVEYHGLPVEGDKAGRWGPAPLMRALKGGHGETVRWLLGAGAVVPGVCGEEGGRGVEMEAVLE